MSKLVVQEVLKCFWSIREAGRKMSDVEMAKVDNKETWGKFVTVGGIDSRKKECSVND